MAKPAAAQGDSIEAGTLYRLVPNWSNHWDYQRNVPEPRAFRKDGGVGVSMIWKERMSLAEIFARRPHLQPFGVCGLSVEELIEGDGVWVKHDPDDAFGDAHVSVMGITKRRVDWLRDLGIKRIIKPLTRLRSTITSRTHSAAHAGGGGPPQPIVADTAG